MTWDRRQIVARALREQFDEPVFVGYDFLPSLKDAIQNGRSFIYADHAYFDRGYERGNFRVIRSDVHQVHLKWAAESKGYEPEFQPWKRGTHILVFPPSKTMARTFDAQSWTDETVAELRKHTDRPIYIKGKADGPLEHFLRDCHAVVGYGTVASVEAAFMGIPVFTGPKCPCTPIGLSDLSLIETPIYPERETWFNGLTWSQFHMSEIESGLCREVLGGP